MKFQSIFILFNIILVFFIAIICLSPALIPGADSIASFWRYNWILLFVLASVLISFDSFYLMNRRLYDLLEKEDWPALIHYLEDKILRQGKYSKRLVKLLANTYLVLSDSPAVMSLEAKAAMVKPSLVDENALVFGTARILGRDIPGAIRFFEAKLDIAKPGLRQWIHWYYGFALLLNYQYEKALDEFSSLVKVCDDGVITGLSAFFMGTTLRKYLPEMKSLLEFTAQEGRDRVLKALPQLKDWDRETTKIKSEIHTAVLAKYMEKTGLWLYQPPDAPKAPLETAVILEV